MVSRRKFEAHEAVPPEWQLRPRIQVISNMPIPSVLPRMDEAEVVEPHIQMTPSVQKPVPESSTSQQAPLPIRSSPTSGIESVPNQSIDPITPTVTRKPIEDTVPSETTAIAPPPPSPLPSLPPQLPPSTTVEATGNIIEPRRSMRTNAGKNPSRYASMAVEDAVDLDGLYVESYREITSMMTQSDPERDESDNIETVTSYRISLREALTQGSPQRQRLAQIAMDDEINSLHRMKVFKYVKDADMPQNHRNRVVPCHMFMKEKLNADGSYQKMKARYVAGGNHVDQSLIGDTKAPTARSISVMALLCRAAIKGHPIGSGDITSAFLVPDIDQNVEEDIQYVRISKAMATEFVRLHPELKEYLNSKGELLARLLKWLYGLPQSAERFATHLSATMTRLGFVPFTGDKCMYSKGTMLVVAHVDDLLFTGSPNEMNEFKRQISRQYSINMQEGDRHSYLGLNIQRGKLRNEADYVIRVTQNGYIRELVNKFAVIVNKYYPPGRMPETPTNNKFCEASPADTPKANSKTYASLVMSLMFLARYTRPDLLFPCSVLSTWCSDPDIIHMKKACRVFKYAAISGDIGITFKKKPIKSTIGADAGHHIHADGRGHGGHTSSLGSGVIFTRSYKVKMTTLSSTETEFCVASDATKIARYVNDLCDFMGTPVRPSELIQDNTSAIWLSKNDGSFARNAHLISRFNFVKEAERDGEIVIKYVNTSNMYPDLLTKPGHSIEEIHRHLQAMGMTMRRSSEGENGPVWSIEGIHDAHNHDSDTEETATAPNRVEGVPNAVEGVAITEQATDKEHHDARNTTVQQPRSSAARARTSSKHLQRNGKRS